MQMNGNKKNVIVGFVVIIVIVYLLSSLFSFLFSKNYSVEELENSPIFNDTYFSNWKKYKGSTFIYEGYLDKIDEDEMIIIMDGETAEGLGTDYHIIINNKNELEYSSFSDNWNNIKDSDYIVIIGEVKKCKDGIFIGNRVYLDEWYYSESRVDDYYLQIQLEKEAKEAEEKRIKEERLLKEQTETLNIILEDIKNTPKKMTEIKTLNSLRNRLIEFKEKYPNYEDMEEIDVLIESLGETVEKLTEIKNEKEEEEKRIIEQRKKELEERKKSIDMSTLSGREGYYELDEILKGLENEIVPSDKVSRFRQLYQELGYYDYRSFKPGQASKITDELHSIVRKPNDMTEVNKLITRFDFFIERCPSILKDDALNNRYEIIGIIIRGLNT